MRENYQIVPIFEYFLAKKAIWQPPITSLKQVIEV